MGGGRCYSCNRLYVELGGEWGWYRLNCRPDSAAALCAAVADDYCFTPPPLPPFVVLIIISSSSRIVLSGRFNDAQIIAQIDFILIG